MSVNNSSSSSSGSVKYELAEHIYQYLCHEAQYSDLPEAARESLTAASECIEQAYKLNVNNGTTSSNNNDNKQISSVLPDELLRIFMRHKEHTQHPMTTRKKLTQLRAQIKRQASKAARSRLEKRSSVGGGVMGTTLDSSNGSNTNFKQKLIALMKKFRTDGSDFDNEEQYREALERELMKAAAGRGSRAIEELLDENIDVEEESGSEPEDNISESSAPKPSLRPFFSSTTLDKI